MQGAPFSKAYALVTCKPAIKPIAYAIAATFGQRVQTRYPCSTQRGISICDQRRTKTKRHRLALNRLLSRADDPALSPIISDEHSALDSTPSNILC